MSGMLNIGVNTIQAVQAQLNTISHNISNASNPDYHAQRLEQTSSTIGQFQQGSKITGTTRLLDSLTEKMQMQQEKTQSYFTQYTNLSSSLNSLGETMLNNINTSVDGIGKAYQALSTDPSSDSYRTALINQMSSFVNAFNSYNGMVRDNVSKLDLQINDTLSEANGLLTDISKLNSQIKTSNSPDLLDQRDALVLKLNKIIPTTVMDNGDNSVNVFGPNGTPLLVGDKAFSLSQKQDFQNKTSSIVTQFNSSTGVVDVFMGQNIQEGSLSALLNMKNDLTTQQGEISAFSNQLAETININNNMYLKKNGNFGSDLINLQPVTVMPSQNNSGSISVSVNSVDYSQLTNSNFKVSISNGAYTISSLDSKVLSSGTVSGGQISYSGITLDVTGSATSSQNFVIGLTDQMSMATNTGDSIAVSNPVQVNSGITNSKTATGEVSVMKQVPVNADLQQTVQIVFTSPTTFDVTGTGVGIPASAVVMSNGQISYNGWTLKITGNPSAGDNFTISQNAGSIGNGVGALTTAIMQKLPMSNGKSFNENMNTSISDIASKQSRAESAKKTADSIVSELTAKRQSMSGVNLDEMASELMKQQQVYAAAGKVIATSEKLFQSILEII